MKSISFTLLLLLTAVEPFLFEDVSETCAESYFVIDVDIQPEDPVSLASCTPGKSRKLTLMIERLVNKKFQDYVEEVDELREETISEFCDVESVRRGRALTLQLANNAFSYTGTSKCTFCNKDSRDVFDSQQGEEQPSAPSSAPATLAPSLDNGVRATAADLELRKLLEQRITRALTRKVNENEKRSCLAGSNSTVAVTLTPVGYEQPPFVCPQQ